jgi:hypothetical protein
MQGFEEKTPRPINLVSNAEIAILRKVKKIKELCGGVQLVRRTNNSAD